MVATVLIVDDRAINREFLAVLLGYAGHMVTEAADGREALACVKASRPALIITDLMMPEMDGLELTRTLRADPATADIPVIFYTATYRVHEARELGRVCGAALVLPKPSEPQTILDAVVSVLGPQALMTPGAPPAGPAPSPLPSTPPATGQRLSPARTAQRAPTAEHGHTPVAWHALGLRLAAALELGLALSAELDSQRLLELFCRATQDILGTRYVGAVILGPGNQAPAAWAAAGLSAEVLADLGRMHPDGGLLGAVLRSTETVIWRHASHGLEHCGLPASHPPVDAVLATPLWLTSGNFGMLYFAGKSDGVAFDEADTQFAATLAAQLAQFYGNRKLFEELQQHAGELRLEIIERMRVAAELRESEARFRQVLENLREVVFLYDPVHNATLYVSPSYESIWQRSRESLYADAESWDDAIHPDDRERVEASKAETRATGHIDNRYRIVQRDGGIRWVRTRGFPVRDAAGHIQRIVGISEDITESRLAHEAIIASEARYRELFNASPLPMWVYDLQTLAFLAVNDAAIAHYGYAREQFLAMSITDIRPVEDLPTLQRNLDAHYASDAIERAGTWRHRKCDGTIIQVEISSHVIDFAGRRGKLVLANDVTQRIEQEQRIARLSRIRAVMGGINSAMLRLTDQDALLCEACRVAATEGVFPLAWCSAYDPHTGAFALVAVHGGDPELVAFIRRIAYGTLPEGQRWQRRGVSEVRPIVIDDLLTEPSLEPVHAELLRRGYRSAAAFPLLVEGSVVAVLVLTAADPHFFDAQEIALLEWLSADLSFALDHLQKAQRLDYLAYYDALTGLANARLFQDRMNQFIHAARPSGGKVCVVVLDLEHFTRINESLGRGAGDELLRQVGVRLEQHLTEPYTLGRIGADTFAAASPRDTDDAPTWLLDRLFDALFPPFQIEGRAVQITAQAGIALYPGDGADGGSVFRSAETALKLARSSNKRHAWYSSALNERLARRLVLEAEMRKAIAGGEFVLHYQARLDMASGDVVGAEALIRWRHPQRGLLLPGEFIALAEETGLIVPIGDWVLDTVCAQQAAWGKSRARQVPIAVNLSSLQFVQGKLLQTVRAALQRHHIEPQLLEVELTESAVMHDPEEAASTLLALRKLGVGLALDDFGTGYSSLAHLKRFPFSAVKIDRSFIAELTQRAEDAAIATAIIAMAHQLRLRVIAEGVETQGQFNYLRAQGCDELQGFLFSPALAADAFEAQLRSGQRLSLPSVDSADAQTLLLVDDEPGIRSALTRVLRRDGYRILSAAGGAEALELLALNPVQVIISDQRMPGMSGTDFLSVVSQLYPDTLRIILSGYTDLMVVTDAVNRGSVFKFLTKPWEEDQLREQVRDAFRRHVPGRQPRA